jgi:hypothetical protein
MLLRVGELRLGDESGAKIRSCHGVIAGISPLHCNNSTTRRLRWRVTFAR